MSIIKDKFIAETGGFAWGEPQHWRLAEITVLEKRIVQGHSARQISGVSPN
jgi:hypothetical protein